MATGATILPDPARLHLLEVSATDTRIIAEVETIEPSARCPMCGGASTRVHSRYVRHVSDLPWHGVAFRLQLHARRFFCDQLDCARRIFTERLPSVVAPHARRTERLTLWLRAVGFAVGGEAGARLLRALGLQAGPDTLVRAIRRTALPPAPRPEVVRVDDWCVRRGQRYGALVVDLARRRVVDLLPDREANTFVHWLQTQPHVAVVSRDRGANFAEGASRGAPQAIQVADRFHVLKNLVEALQQVLGREHSGLRSAAQQAAQRSGYVEAAGAGDLAARRGDTAPRQRARVEAQARRQLRYEACWRLHTAGKRVREIVDAVRLGPNTVRRFLRAESCPQEAPHASHASRLSPFEPYLRERWDAGEQNGRRLLADIRARGYRGSGSNLYTLLAQGRPGPRRPGPYPRQPRVTPAPLPSVSPAPRSVGWLLVRQEDDRLPQEAVFVREVLQRSPTIATMCGAVRRFFVMLRQRQVEGLGNWRDEADASGIAELAAFAQGVRRDLLAIQTACTSPWSQGQTAGQITRLKLLKRQMYGRAHFDLLRQRVVYRSVG
jgi:transposase